MWKLLLSIGGNFTNNGGNFETSASVNINGNYINSSSGVFTISSSDSVGIGGNFTGNSGTTNSFAGNLGINGNLELNGAGLTANGTLEVGGNSTVNSNGNLTTESNFSTSNLTNNGGDINMGNGSIAVGGNFTNNGSGNSVNEGELTVSGNSTLNSGSFTNDSTGTFRTHGNMTVNGSSTLLNKHVTIVQGKMTGNSGTLTTQYYLEIDQGLTNYGGSTITGSGVLRLAESHINYGTISGTLDICDTANSTPPSFSGSGTIAGTVTFCTDAFLLPVDLLYFSAAPEDEKVLIRWETASERNNKEFLVERSYSGDDFEAIAVKEGQGNRNSLMQYSVVDHPESTMAYYRLKQIDFNGEVNYSGVVVVNLEELSDRAKVFPNPSSGSFDIQSDFMGKYEWRIYDLSGKMILQEVGEKSDDFLPMNLSLKNGVYLLEFVQGNLSFQERLIIHH